MDIAVPLYFVTGKDSTVFGSYFFMYFHFARSQGFYFFGSNIFGALGSVSLREFRGVGQAARSYVENNNHFLIFVFFFVKTIKTSILETRYR